MPYTQNQAGSSKRWFMDENSYEVGYGKPPKHTQFQKGRSGNPKGRPKRNKNIYDLVKKAFEERVTVKSPGRTHSMTKLEAALAQLANKAASGDIKALREAIRLREKLQEQEPFLTPAPAIVVEFIRSRAGKPVTSEDEEEDRRLGYPYAKSFPDDFREEPS
jgi:hypothetical protein